MRFGVDLGARWTSIAAAACMLAFWGCSEESSPVGNSFLPQNQRLAFHTLDSRSPSDSIFISSRQVSVAIPAGAATDMLLGRAGQTECRPLYKFAYDVDTIFVDTILGSRAFTSTYLQLPLAAYRFGDTSASISFSISVHEILTDYQSGATWDSLGASSNYGPSVGTFTGTIGMKDSLLKIPIDATFLRHLLSYRRFDSLSAGFHGLALLPQSSDGAIIGIKAGAVQIRGSFVYDTTSIDTSFLSAIQHLYIANSMDVDPPDRLIAQSGVAKRGYLTFSIPKLPILSTVNSATLDLTLDPSASQWGKDYVRDTLTLSGSDSLYLYLASGDSALGTYRVLGTRLKGTNVYQFLQLRDYVELWKHGTANHGATPVQSIGGISDDVSTVDRFAFYLPTAADTTLRPRLRIIYSTLGK